METPQMREKLLEYINNGDEKMLEMLYEAAVGYTNDGDGYTFTKEDIAILEQRRNARINGESEVYDWETAKAMITGRT